MQKYIIELSIRDVDYYWYILGYIIAAVPGLISLYFYSKTLKLQEPKISFHIMKGSYIQKKKRKEKKDLVKETLFFNLSFLFKNHSNASGSITDIIAQIRYHKETLEKYPFLLDMIGSKTGHNEKPLNFDELIPIEIGSYGSRNIDFVIKFEDVYTRLLDRCNVAINPHDPKIPKWDDLPIVINISAHYTKGIITRLSCIFREDLPESQRTYGAIDTWKLDEKFFPKIDFEK